MNVIKSFQECCDDIIHSSTDSALGAINSTARQNIHNLLSKEDFFPAFRAWTFDLTSTQLTQALTVSGAAIFSVLWETFNFREFFLPTVKESSINDELVNTFKKLAEQMINHNINNNMEQLNYTVEMLSDH